MYGDHHLWIESTELIDVIVVQGLEMQFSRGDMHLLPQKSADGYAISLNAEV